MASTTPKRRDMSYYRAPSLFQPHRTRQALRDWRSGLIPTMNAAFVGLTHPSTALFLAPMGFDHIIIDQAHSSCNVETITQMVHNISFGSEGKTIPWVRIPGHSHELMAYALDAGASIMVPQVDTVEQARHVVSSAKFGLKDNGTRSAPPFRFIPGLTDTPFDASRTLHENLNDQAAICIQLETAEAVNNLDAILTEVPGIDAVWLGMLDARVSMGLPGNPAGGNEPEWLAVVDTFEKTVAKHSEVVWMGFAFGDDEALRRGGRGKAIVCTGGDLVALMGLMGTVDQSRRVLDEVWNENVVPAGAKGVNGVDGGKAEVVVDAGQNAESKA